MNANETKLSFFERLAYGIGTAGEMFPFMMVNIYLYVFFNTVMGIPAMTVGTIFLIARIWDAINDPIMGILADRTNTRWGSYRPWAFFATFPALIFGTLCFLGPDFESMTLKVIFCTVVYIGFGMSNTASIIPLGSMINVLSNDYEERQMLGSFREFGSSLGTMLTTIIIGTVMSATIGMGMSETTSYTVTMFVMGVLSCIVLGISFAGTRERFKPEIQGNFFSGLKALKGNTPAISVILFYFCVSMALCARQSFNAYYAIYYLNDGTLATSLITAMSVAPFFIMWFVPGLSKKWGKRNNMLLGCAFGTLSGILYMVAGTSIAMAYVSSFVLGLGQNLLYSGVWASLPDCADYGEYKNGVRAPGFIFSVAQFGMKCAMSLSAMLISVVLVASGFDETVAVQSESALNGIYVFNWTSIAVFMVLAALFLIPYNLTEAKMKEVRAALDNK